MARVRQLIVDPKHPQSIVEQVKEIVLAVDGAISFGDPQDPTAPTSTTLAGSAAGAHAGNLQNVEGSWASALVTTLDAAVRFHHNLNVPLSVAGRPNVRVLAFWYEHDGWNGAVTNAATGVATVSYNFQNVVDAVTATYVELRFYAAAPRVVSVAHPLRVDLFFTPAVSR